MMASCSGVSNVMLVSVRSGKSRQFLGWLPADIQPWCLTHGNNGPSGPSSNVDPAGRVTPLTVMSSGQYLKFQSKMPFPKAIVERGGLVHLHSDRQMQ